MNWVPTIETSCLLCCFCNLLVLTSKIYIHNIQSNETIVKLEINSKIATYFNCSNNRKVIQHLICKPNLIMGNV